MTKIIVRGSAELAPYTSDLQALEEHETYPLAGTDNTFKISHGRRYPFFFEKIGSPRFFLAIEKKTVIGSMVVVEKQVELDGGLRPALYFCDLKIRRDYRGKNVSKKIFLKAFQWILKTYALSSWPICYFVAMQGDQGDFLVNSKIPFLRYAFSAVAESNIFFAKADRLIRLGNDNFDSLKTISLTLPKTSETEVIDLGGIKDIIIDGLPSPIKHAAVSGEFMKNTLGQLGNCFSKLNDDDQLCFSVDTRIRSVNNALNAVDIYPTGRARVYSLSWQAKHFGDLPLWIGTNEI